MSARALVSFVCLAAIASAAPASAQPEPTGESEGFRLFSHGEYERAAPLLEKASSALPDRPDLARALGLCYLRLNNVNGARTAFARLFSVRPESATARLLTAKMMIAEELEDMAEPELQSAAKLDPKLPELHYLLGELAIYGGDYDKGIAELREEIAINPAFAMAYYRLGDALGRKELWDQAIAPLQKSIWLNPDFSSPYILLGKTYYKTNRLEFAEGMLKRAIRMDPNNAGAHYLLATVYRTMGRQEDASKELELWQEAKKK